jgi:hypothetical protein
MRIDETRLSIANLRDMLARKDLVANKQYQRAPGIWPNAPRSYFIETILEGFPFPKMYFHEFLERASKKTRTEIVDGQQRITTISDFLSDAFALSRNSKYPGLKFSQLPDEVQDDFLQYTVSVDVIRDADRVAILQMFRRMNAYTLPLNDAEKRHAEFFGEFKEYVNAVADKASILTEWEVFTTRQILRMGDAEFVADLTLALEDGIGNTTKAALDQLYARYEKSFPNAAWRESQLLDAFAFIGSELSELRTPYVTKEYVFYALCCALLHSKDGIPGLEAQIGLAPIGRYMDAPRQQVISQVLELAAAHESKDMTRFGEYVEAMAGGSNREKQRLVRVRHMCLALRGALTGR